MEEQRGPQKSQIRCGVERLAVENPLLREPPKKYGQKQQVDSAVLNQVTSTLKRVELVFPFLLDSELRLFGLRLLRVGDVETEDRSPSGF